MANEFDGPPWGHEVQLKDNLCKMVFLCLNRKDSECVYYQRCDMLDDGTCDHAKFTELSDFSYCGSSVARVNKMTLEMKRLGINI